MKPEESEKLFIIQLYEKSQQKMKTLQNVDHIERLTGDASTRRYYRINSVNDSYIACLDQPSQEGKNLFVEKQKIFFEHNIRVPKILDCDLQKGYLLEEDLGDETLLSNLSRITSRGEEEKIYEKALHLLMELHRVESEDLKSQFPLRFDKEKFQQEIDFTLKYFIDLLMGNNSTLFSQELSHLFSEILNPISQQKMVPTHRDYHSRNIMIKNSELVMIDFQDARLGIPQYDLCSLLDDCYYDVHHHLKQKLLKYYYQEFQKGPLSDQGSYEDFFRFYQLTTLQRVFKAIGSFSYIYHLRKDIRYLKYISFGMEKIKAILFEFPEYEVLKKRLFGIYYGN